VGTKLAAATMALVFLVTSVIYVAISRYQRENLLLVRSPVQTNALTMLFDTQGSWLRLWR